VIETTENLYLELIEPDAEKISVIINNANAKSTPVPDSESTIAETAGICNHSFNFSKYAKILMAYGRRLGWSTEDHTKVAIAINNIKPELFA